MEHERAGFASIVFEEHMFLFLCHFSVSFYPTYKTALPIVRHYCYSNAISMTRCESGANVCTH